MGGVRYYRILVAGGDPLACCGAHLHRVLRRLEVKRQKVIELRHGRAGDCGVCQMMGQLAEARRRQDNGVRSARPVQS